MESKQQILSSIRRSRVPETALPDLAQPWITYPDRLAQFTASLEFVGGRAARVSSVGEIDAKLGEMPAWTGAKKTLSLVPGAGKSTFDLSSVDDPHTLEDVDFAILPGQFAVAENGAVWITDENLRQRAIYFIVQHLALVIAADQIVDNMYQAYERLQFSGAGFGAFISGPSKTADIEQSLVIGAHGPRSMTVFAVGS
jgi:L-lactate dehydrogenase complex protein LldG